MIYIPDSLKDSSKVCVGDKILECYGSAEEVLKIVKARDTINKNITIIAAGGIKFSNIEEYACSHYGRCYCIIKFFSCKPNGYKGCNGKRMLKWKIFR